MMINDLRKRLKSYHTADLPLSYRSDIADERQQAAVLLPIVTREDACLLRTLRSMRLGSHAGEVAWPGGKQDKFDTSLQHTALRETAEEIGIAIDQVEILAELRPFISKFGLMVTPFVGLVASDVSLKLNTDEIDSVFYLPLKYLLNDPRTGTNIIERHGERRIVPEYRYQGFRIWGLTAMILTEFMIHGLGMHIVHPIE